MTMTNRTSTRTSMAGIAAAVVVLAGALAVRTDAVSAPAEPSQETCEAFAGAMIHERERHCPHVAP